jgi:hypothetical protein
MISVSPSDIRTPKSVGVGAASTGFDIVAAPSIINNAAYPAMPGMAGVGTEPLLKDLNGTFDNLHDMDVDLSGWNFPDFWAFDLGGDF